MTQQVTPTMPVVDDRVLQALRFIIRDEFPRLAFEGLKAYAVQAVTGTGDTATVTVAPVDATLGLPPLVDVPLKALNGVACTPRAGTECVVVFLNGNPASPRVFSYDAAPDAIELAGSGPAVARVGDTVSISAANLTAAMGSNTGGPVTFAQSAAGTITSGSAKVDCA